LAETVSLNRLQETMLADGDWVEKAGNLVKINDFDPDTVEAMLRYIYCNRLTVATTEVLLIADKYNVKDLFRCHDVCPFQFLLSRVNEHFIFTQLFRCIEFYRHI
jgi:hypothetical protein